MIFIGPRSSFAVEADGQRKKRLPFALGGNRLALVRATPWLPRRVERGQANYEHLPRMIKCAESPKLDLTSGVFRSRIVGYLYDIF